MFPLTSDALQRNNNLQMGYEKVVKKTTILWGLDNIIYITAIGDTDMEEALESNSVVCEIISVAKEKPSILINLNNCGKQAPEARKLWEEMNNKELVKKVAFHGIHPVSRIIASFIIMFTSNYNLKFFSREQEAINWLKS